MEGKALNMFEGFQIKKYFHDHLSRLKFLIFHELFQLLMNQENYDSHFQAEIFYEN